MRSIQLKRADRVVTEIDLYDLLIKADKSKDAPVMSGDVIYFPPVRQLAAISGSVNVPAIFELKGNATLSDLLRWSGGLSTSASGQKVTVERIDNRRTRQVEEFMLDATGEARNLRDGDLVTVYSITPRFENIVSLRGNVAQPARFAWRPNIRVSDLIPEKEAVLTRDYWTRRNVLQAPPLPAAGAAPASGSSGIGRVVGEVNWDYAVIERSDVADLSTRLIPFNLGKAILDKDPENNLLLRPGDVLTIFSKEDIRVPEAKRNRIVRLEGEFVSAGFYKAEPGETLRQLVARIGGLTPNAYLYGADFSRESTRVQQELRLQDAVARLEQDIQRRVAVRSANVIAPEEAALIKQQGDTLVSRMRTIKPTGRIILELPDNPELKDLPDLALEDGDRFLVPPKPSIVSVFGSVYNESAFIHKTDKRVSDYLAQAGGTTRDADSGNIYMIRADGSVLSKRQSGFLSSALESSYPRPGDAIIVPEEFERTSFTRIFRDWTQILYQFGLGAAAIKVLTTK